MSDVLALSKKYDVSASCDLFWEAEMRQLGGAGTDGFKSNFYFIVKPIQTSSMFFPSSRLLSPSMIVCSKASSLGMSPKFPDKNSKPP